MSEWLVSVPAFILAIGVLVAVHEWGHFWVARRLGVRVLRFSIGFGSRLWGRTARDGTEYWISAVPLGGYVKMLDEREGPVESQEAHLAFNRQPPWKRILIVAAGPGLNFLFAIAAYWAIFMIGIPGLKPLLAEVPRASIAYAAGLRGGEEVLSVEGETTVTWNELRTSLLKSALREEAVQLRVRSTDGDIETLTLDLSGMPADPEKLFSTLGMNPFQPRIDPIIGTVETNSPAARAGLRSGDRVLMAGDQAIEDWAKLVEWIRAHPGSQSRLLVLRGGSRHELSIEVGAVGEGDVRVGRIGAGVDVNPDLWQDLQAVRKYGPLQAIPAAVVQTWDLSVLTLKLMGRMLTGDVSWRNVSGPIQIAQYAGYTASIGLVSFLGFLALVSVSLGVLNLLPIPVLDGGHLLYYGFELVRGKPLSEPMQAFGQKVGMALLLALMCVAFYNDIARLLTQ
jgi:regulator of sigma E protease